MTAPRWATSLLRLLAPPDEAEILIGDLEEVHRARVGRRGVLIAALLTSLEAVDIAFMLARRRLHLPGPTMSWLDFKLAVRMLVRYPVLTIVGIGALACGIAIGAVVFAFISMLHWPRLPLPKGDRIVIVSHHDAASNQPESRVTTDYLRLSGGTGTLTDFAAGRGMARNLQMGNGIVEPISVAEVTASMFSMTRVAPILGRTLTDGDGLATAPPVIVIGERIWRERFAADPAILTKHVLLSNAPVAVVGVMPAAFRFPSTFEAWQPLKIDTAAAPRSGVSLRIWARLKPGVTPAQANAELAVLGGQAAADWPATHAHLKAAVFPAAATKIEQPRERAAAAAANLVIGLMLLLVSGNVALLMFARAATRESEILVRTALGASRGRLVAQFVTEAFVLCAIAAVAGLALGQQAMTWAMAMFTVMANDGQPLPFWYTPALPPISVAYGIGLALFATAVTGILPALKMTTGIASRLRETNPGGGGLAFGGLWTVLIVGQITVTVAFPAFAFFLHGVGSTVENQEIGVPQEQYLSARMTRESGMSQARFEAAVRRVRDDFAAVPGIGRVTLANTLPLMWNGFYEIEVDDGGAAPRPQGQFNAYFISTAAVEPDFFPTFEARAVAGRLLVPGDYSGTPRVVVVNQSFIEKVLGGRNPVGRHIRYVERRSDGQRVPGAAVPPWIEIVGVVRDLGMAVPPAPNTAGGYVPLELRAVNAVHIAARVSGDMTEATNALRSVAAKADPTLRLADVQSLAQTTAKVLRTFTYAVRTLSVVSLSALVLALSGIYAIMSFAVSRRTREIGIRLALGARPSRVVLTILRRPFLQVTAGIVVGGISTFLIARGFHVSLSYSPWLFVYALVMLGVCLLACIVPARRTLKVDPIAALRVD